MAQAPAAAPPPGQEVEYEAVIGIETHVQLLTRSKAFCSCSNQYGDEPNTNVCAVCLGHPGSLPALNAEAVRLGIKAGLALNSTIARRSAFDRKQYFYPDLPKGYQISQYQQPLLTGGYVEVWEPPPKRAQKKGAGGGPNPEGEVKRFRITRAHLEEDAGKNVHGGGGGGGALSGSSFSLVDFNRAGVPLLEVVSEPDMRSGREAAAYGAELRRLLRFIGVSDGNMAEGSMRCDVNVSVRPRGTEAFGTRVEVKNMNSFSNMQKAIEFEVERQVALLRSGRGSEVVQETRLWDEGKEVTVTMRKKEGLADYRYFPEPDLPALEVDEATINEVAASMAEPPAAKRRRLLGMGLPAGDVAVLTDELATAEYFDAAMAAGAPAKAAANWVMGDIMAWCKERNAGLEAVRLPASDLAQVIAMIEEGVISGKIAKDMLPALLEGAAPEGVRAYVEAQGLLQISDVGAVEAMVSAVLAAHPQQLADYRAGKTKLAGFFTGQVMKESAGRVNPGLMNQVLMRMLNEGKAASAA